MKTERQHLARFYTLLLFGLTTTGWVVALDPEKDEPAKRPSAIELKPCKIPGLEEEVKCGTYEVYEDRDAQSGRKISLNIVVVPSLSENPAPDPVFVFSGGPGTGATNGAGFRAQVYANVRKDRDIVFVDQRGTGESNPLNCTPLGPEDHIQTYIGEMYPKEYLERCRQDLEKIADLSLYTTPIAMDDIHEVRAALGYEKINLTGGSYGTRAALVYMRRHPETVRSAFLGGVAPTNMAIPATFAQETERAMKFLLADCAADEDCQTAYPELEQKWAQVLDRFKKGPAKAKLSNPRTKSEEEVVYGHGSLIAAIRSMLYSTGNSSQIPWMIYQMADGKYEDIVRYTLNYNRWLSKFLADGMYLSVTCAEDIPLIDVAAAVEASRGTFLGSYRVDQQVNACKNWVKGRLPEGFYEPVRSDIPALIMTGHLDPVTPPNWGEAVAKHLSASLHVVVPNASHGLGNTYRTCIEPLYAQFLAKGSVNGLDASCVEKTKRPPFKK